MSSQQHRVETTVPIRRDGRTFEQSRRDMLSDIERGQHRGSGGGTIQKSERRTMTTRTSDSSTAPRLTSDNTFSTRTNRLDQSGGMRDDWDKEVSHWVDESRRRWDEDMERINRDMMSLEPTDNFGSDPWGDRSIFRSSRDPMSGGGSSSLMAQMEREMDAMRRQSPFGSGGPGSTAIRPSGRGGGSSYESSSSFTKSSTTTTTRSGSGQAPITHTNVEESAKSSQTIDGVTTGTSSHSKTSDTTKGHHAIGAGSHRTATPGAIVQAGAKTKEDGINVLRNAYEIGPDNQVHFRVRFDARDFVPDDINVTTVDKQLTVHAKKIIQTDAGQSVREFSRTIDLPMSIDHAGFQCNLTEDGMLILDAPVNAPDYNSITFDKDNNLGIKPQAEMEANRNSRLTMHGQSGFSIETHPSGKICHLEVPIDPEYTADELCVRTDANHIIVTGKKEISKDQRSNSVIMPKNFTKSFEVPESIDLMSVTAQMVGNTLIVEAPLQR